MTNFGSSKNDLSHKYRLGLEHALAKADFLNAPDIILVQAFTLFLALLRRHDSPRFVWMLTGLVIRMAQYLGLQRDGTHFEHLTPFEIEMRRRVWWGVCMLDVRASEDQGTDLTIANGSHDTRIPLNVNDADISPEMTQMPPERKSVTDMSFARINFAVGEIVTRIMASGVKDGTAGLQDQSRMLDEICQEFELGYFSYVIEPEDVAYRAGVIVGRLVVAKMTLIVYLPVLFSPPSEQLSDDIRTKLLVSAIEVAEYNHALNSEPAYRRWRWLYQSYTHWHAIVYLMIEITRRPWSSTVERAWIALHSNWLIPSQKSMEKNLRIWVPLRKLMDKARKHRDAEINRLRADPQAAVQLDTEDQKIPPPSSSGPFSAGSSVDIFRERWRQLVDMPGPNGTKLSGAYSTGISDAPIYTYGHPAGNPGFDYQSGNLSSNTTFEPTPLNTSKMINRISDGADIKDLGAVYTTNNSTELGLGQMPYPIVPTDWSSGSAMELGSEPWLWTNADPSADDFYNLDISTVNVGMDLDGEVNWYNWVESAKGMEWNEAQY
jgi:hypothetical protein